jgi:peptidoglycan-associated lipoprotein
MESPSLGLSDPSEVSLQAVAITPARVAALTETAAEVIGSGFVQGATVQIGETESGAARFMDQNTLALTLPPLSPGVYDVTVQNPDTRTATMRNALTVGAVADATETCPPVRVLFALDSSKLDDTARKALDAQHACLSETPGPLHSAGHADERGTTDYNLALGQRRAEAVAHHLGVGGIASSRIVIVSYGEERPMDPGHTQKAWEQNRRVDVEVR